jgi:hypothetical protein
MDNWNQTEQNHITESKQNCLDKAFNLRVGVINFTKSEKKGSV